MDLLLLSVFKVREIEMWSENSQEKSGNLTFKKQYEPCL